MKKSSMQIYFGLLRIGQEFFKGWDLFTYKKTKKTTRSKGLSLEQYNALPNDRLGSIGEYLKWFDVVKVKPSTFFASKIGWSIPPVIAVVVIVILTQIV